MTLLEITVVIIIISLITAFAIADYSKRIELDREKIAVNNLRILDSAFRSYYIEYGDYSNSGGLQDISYFSNILPIHIIPEGGLTFNCDAGRFMGTPYYNCRAGPSSGWLLVVYSDTQGTTPGGTPYCNFGPCPSCKDQFTGGCS